MEKAANHKNADHAPLPGGGGEAGNTTFIGVSKATQNVISLVEMFAGDPRGEPVLITGERGTGKELVARMIHERSCRLKNPEVFVQADCGALHKETSHSTLFGHLKGSFTDACKDHVGFFAEADGGTLFIDEIGNLIRPIQPLMLRAIQAKTFRKLGADYDETSSARLIFATNRDLDELYTSVDFMDDLLDRLNRRHIHIPPLRERKEDIRVLAEHFAAYYAKAYQLEYKIKIASEVYRFLDNYDFPGNVRQLDTFFSFAFLNLYHTKEKVLNCNHLPPTKSATTHSISHANMCENNFEAFLTACCDDYLEKNRHLWDGLPSSEVPCLINKNKFNCGLSLAVYKKARHNKAVAAKLLGLTVGKLRGFKRPE